MFKMSRKTRLLLTNFYKNITKTLQNKKKPGKIFRILEEEHSTFEELQLKMSLKKATLKWHLDFLENGFCVEKQVKNGKLGYILTQEGKVVEFLD